MAKLVDNQKVSEGILATAGTNTNVWYQRDFGNRFTINGSFSNIDNIFDWIGTKSIDERLYKSGVLKFCGNSKTALIEFDSPFPSSDYFLFYCGNSNVNLYTVSKSSLKAVVKGSFDLNSEITWFAFHKNLSLLTGSNNPNSIFCGSRNILGKSVLLNDKLELDMTDDSDANLNLWYNGEMIIKPQGTDGYIENMNLGNYSIVLSSNVNINMFWTEKEKDRVKIATSFECPCIVDFFIVKVGANWWQELRRAT
jgi:hypothetical protein